MFRKAIFVTLLCVVSFVMPLSVAAQTAAGSLAGVVRDSSGALAPGATVRATNEATSVATETVTDEQGGYRLEALVHGAYRRETVLDCFETALQQVSVRAGAALTADVTLQVSRLMQGDLVVESTTGKGSVFTFSFEAAAEAIEAVPGRVLHPIPTGLDPQQPACKVLIVDDVATNRDLLDELLARLGVLTRSSASAEEAIVAHDEWHPDLVLMDLRMPGMNGLEAIRLLRARGSGAAIIAVTASGLADSENEAREAGADAFVRKPYREGQLLSVIGAQLNIRYVYDSLELQPMVASRDTVRYSTLSQRLSGLPSALIEQLRDAAIEGRARRLESLADQARQHSEEVSEEIRALARDFQYDVLVSALPSRTSDEA